MSDVPTVGDIVNANAEQTAIAAASETLENIPETTVVVEDSDTTTDPAFALEYAEHIREIAREEADNQILGWIAIAEANKPPEPEVVVVPTPPPMPPPTPAPTPAPMPEGMAETSGELEPDEAPPRDHWYFKPRGKRKS